MRITSDGFADNGVIPDQFAFCTPDAATHVRFSKNRNPHLAWSDAPADTRSFALVCVDSDAPSVGDDVNVEGETIPADLARVDFAHWAMIDIAARVREIEAGSCSEGVTARGKESPNGPTGSRQGTNDYTSWFAGDADMEGRYRGYDGPCPPWNDEVIHRYRFTLFSLDVDRLDLRDGFSASDVTTGVQGHVLGEAVLTGTYTLHPGLRAGQ